MSNKTQTIITEEELIKNQTINDEVVGTGQPQTTPVVEQKQSGFKALWNKGLEFAGKHKFGIGVALGVGSVIAADYAISKVEEKYSITKNDILDAEFTEVEPKTTDDNTEYVEDYDTLDTYDENQEEEVIVDESEDTDE